MNKTMNKETARYYVPGFTVDLRHVSADAHSDWRDLIESMIDKWMEQYIKGKKSFGGDSPVVDLDCVWSYNEIDEESGEVCVEILDPERDDEVQFSITILVS